MIAPRYETGPTTASETSPDVGTALPDRAVVAEGAEYQERDEVP